jgi:hypothetical protein
MQTNNRSYTESYGNGKSLKYQKGATLQAGAGVRGLNLEYNSPVTNSDWSSKYGLNIPMSKDQKFSALVSGTHGNGPGFTSTGELSYLEGQGLKGRIDQGYTMQLGKDKLRAGKGKLQVTPYVGVQPDFNGFANEFLEKEDSGTGMSSTDYNGNKRGVFHGGLKVEGEYKPSKYPLYLYGKGQAEFATKGPQQDVVYKDGKTIYGDIHHGSLFDPNINFNAEAGVRYKIGENTERGKIKKRFADGGVLLYKK